MSDMGIQPSRPPWHQISHVQHGKSARSPRASGQNFPMSNMEIHTRPPWRRNSHVQHGDSCRGQLGFKRALPMYNMETRHSAMENQPTAPHFPMSSIGIQPGPSLLVAPTAPCPTSETVFGRLAPHFPTQGSMPRPHRPRCSPTNSARAL